MTVPSAGLCDGTRRYQRMERSEGPTETAFSSVSQSGTVRYGQSLGPLVVDAASLNELLVQSEETQQG